MDVIPLFQIDRITIAVQRKKSLKLLHIIMHAYLSQICQHWLSQCFWNFLDWREVCLYLALCILFGVDYQVGCHGICMYTSVLGCVQL